ncbi:hypothetical protein JCM10213_004422 [Rhodosporidiobolus nylandii]
MSPYAQRQTARCYLIHLPPAVLQQILRGVPLSPSQVPLSKALLPHTLEALFYDVQLFSRESLVQFCAALNKRPELEGKIREFGLSSRDDDDEGDSEPDTDDEMGSEEELSGGMRRIGLGSPAQRANIPLLKSLFRRLVNLKELTLCGKAYYKPILSRAFLEDGLFTRVSTVAISLNKQEDLEEEDDAKLCRDLSLLPALKHVEIWGGGEEAPCDLLNLSFDVALAPRSWSLESFKMRQKPFIGVEARNLWRSFLPGFTHLKIEANGCYADFAEDLALLPPTLVGLDLNFGMSCTYDTAGPLPVLDTVILSFPSLKHLHLGGNLLTPAIFPNIQRLTSLVCVLFDYHCALTGDGMLPLIEGPNRLPRLSALGMHICQCPRNGGTIPLPRWLPALKRPEAQRIVAAAKRAGIRVGGNLLCATRDCDPHDGKHNCARHG